LPAAAQEASSKIVSSRQEAFIVTFIAHLLSFAYDLPWPAAYSYLKRLYAGQVEVCMRAVPALSCIQRREISCREDWAALIRPYVSILVRRIEHKILVHFTPLYEAILKPQFEMKILYLQLT
jgi:hypothetical protein